MCGIFGYVGFKSNAAQIALEGLKLLEYRGYDSWGVAVKLGKKLVVEKHIGKITLAKTELPKSSLGIGHTRWATHGGVTITNAHPHLDCSGEIAVVHNGIVENFEDLKHELVAKGHDFKSGTDTEVIAHLIEDYIGKERSLQGFASSVRDAFNRLKGLSAIVVAYAPSSEIIAVKTGSPLVVGVLKNELFVASDASAIVQHTKKVLFLEDRQMVILGKKLQLLRLPEGKQIIPIFHTINWEFAKAQKGKHKHFLLKEIHEQPKVIENIALHYIEETQQLSKLITDAFGTFMLGCGSASYAALAGTYLFSRIAKKHVNFSIGSEFTYLEDYLTPESLLIAISQSGETIDVVEPVEKAKKKGSQIAALVNVLGSTLYRQANHKILLGAGVEKAVISTKSFIAMISVLLLTAYTMAKRQNEAQEMLRLAANNIRLILQDSYVKHIKTLSKKLSRTQYVFVIGRGLSYAIALETTLKLKETSYTHAEGFAGGELKHGVIALIEKGTPCIVIAPQDETYNEIISNAQQIKARGGYIVGIGSRKNDVFDLFFETADVGDATMLPQVVIAQLIAYYTALAKGISDPDKPRNLAKSVTVK
ncbi:MAG: glutamine--fructose-6-phosphate transaminase (isomerizing) [Candidatus Levyibacteriota bacterium]|nr:MAG: glutamine--fructose-6-phosphate transaminase (isomerizing) [Candidatus Levybacteria bacterium]